MKEILLGITGSVAATLAPRLVTALQELGTVSVVVTRAATHFFDPAELGVQVYTTADEWKTPRYIRDQSILHIELRRSSHILVIAPCSADTLASLAGGHASTLLTAVARAWDRRKPIVLAPAMNTFMWEHPVTEEHLATLNRWYGKRLTVVQSVAKRLACGDDGIGALAPIQAIAEAAKVALQ